MAKLVTEIYVSVKGKEYTKLDLHKDESFEMKYTTKDLQDISKIFAPYSQSFTFPASPKNLGAFGFFGYTDVVKINTENKFRSKVYVNGILYLTGFIQLSSLKYKMNKPTDFTGSFTSTMIDLKSRVGDDTLQDLGIAKIDYSYASIFTSLKSIKNVIVNDVIVKYFIPLASNIRVVSANALFPLELQDNIAYKSTSNPNGFNVLNPNEVRPAVSLSSVFELIKKKYNLDITAPIEKENEFKDAYLYCNSDKIQGSEPFLLKNTATFGGENRTDAYHSISIPTPRKYTIIPDIIDSSFEVTKVAADSGYYNFFTFRTIFEGLSTTVSAETESTIIVQIVRKSDGLIICSTKKKIEGTSLTFAENIHDAFFISDKCEFYAQAIMNQSTSWSVLKFEFNQTYLNYDTPGTANLSHAVFTRYSGDNSGLGVIDGLNTDLIKLLPPTKISDFLGSFFKSYNISIFDSSPNNENLFFLTPGDIETVGNEYSKTTLDYTGYVNVKTITKSTSSDYNYYNFKHVKSKYKSNVDYFTINGLEYGQTVYPSVKPLKAIEYKIETSFSIVPPRTMGNTVDNHTFYAFTSEAPKVLETGESRYKPNYNELTLFYSHGVQNLEVPIGVKTTNLANVIVTQQLSQYVKVMPFNLDGDSFSFSILKENNVEYPINLFSKYYANQIIRLLNPNVLTWEVELTLPPDEIYLNESTTVQNGGDTPTGFRLQNDIIIGENLFSIIDAEITVNNGKTKMKLLNY